MTAPCNQLKKLLRRILFFRILFLVLCCVLCTDDSSQHGQPQVKAVWLASAEAEQPGVGGLTRSRL